jgi:hypothetical protein
MLTSKYVEQCMDKARSAMLKILDPKALPRYVFMLHPNFARAWRPEAFAAAGKAAPKETVNGKGLFTKMPRKHAGHQVYVSWAADKDQEVYFGIHPEKTSEQA